ncbi:MAG: PEP-CTERM sorting domain-containing protein [Planctomycetota bacterium]
MPAVRSLVACLACALTASVHAAIDDLTAWDLYTDSSGATPTQLDAMTGSSAANLAQLNFIDDVDQNAGFDVGFSSVNANTVAGSTSGYYFDASADFTIAIEFELTLTSPDGFVGIGFGIGEDRAGVNSAGVAFGVGTAGISIGSFGAAATNQDSAITKLLSPAVSPTDTYAGSLSVAYNATTGDITVGAAAASGSSTPLAATGTATFTAAELPDWAGDGLVASFFLRSDDPSIFANWTGETAEADFFNFTVVQGSATQVPEPASLALLGLGLGLISCRHR